MTTHNEQLGRVIELLEQLVDCCAGGTVETNRRVAWVAKNTDVYDAPGGSKVGWKVETGDEFDVLAEMIMGKDVWYQLGLDEWVKAAKAMTV